jgi:hypothetical protein
MLRGVKKKHAEIASQIYSMYGYRPFTPKDVNNSIGNNQFTGFLVLTMKRNKQIIEIDREYFSKDDKFISTYRLSKDMIVWLEKHGYINKGSD